MKVDADVASNSRRGEGTERLFFSRSDNVRVGQCFGGHLGTTTTCLHLCVQKKDNREKNKVGVEVSYP